MLCVTRRVREAVYIDVAGRRIVVELLTAERGKARLGIAADQDVKILRAELAEMDEAGVEPAA